ncbi:MAG: flagellar basal body rod protein FlgC [Rhizomicrobium sp.]
MRAAQISLTGLDVEWRRLEIITENLANMNTTRAGAGGPYRARHLVSGPRVGFDAYLHRSGNATAAPAAVAGAIEPDEIGGVMVYGIEVDRAPPRMVREPGNPDADAEGLVAYPNIDHAEQMTLMVKTTRAYEANIVAMNAARQMYAKALELGKRS